MHAACTPAIYACMMRRLSFLLVSVVAAAFAALLLTSQLQAAAAIRLAPPPPPSLLQTKHVSLKGGPSIRGGGHHHHHHHAAPAPAPLPSVHISFNLATDTYQDMYSRLQAVLKRRSIVPYKPSDVMGRHVLGPRRSDFFDQPKGWIMVDVVGEAPEDKATLALADDDLYLLGFSNRSGHWHVVSDGSTGLPEATKLPIERRYGALIHGGHEFLYQVRLGKQSAIAAVKILARYGGSGGEEQVKDAMVRFVVMISEATRFRAIRLVFAAGNNWERETHISPVQSKYVVHWGQLSLLLIRWQQSNYKRWGVSKEFGDTLGKEIGVHNALDALHIIEFLVRPKGGSST